MPSSFSQQAEETLRNKFSNQNINNLSVEEIHALVYELQVHQVELELQNEELVRREVELQISKDRFFNLFEFAPISCLLLDEKGIITKANLASRTLLNIANSSMLSKPFTDFIQKDHQDKYNLFWNRLLVTRQPQTIEIKLDKREGNSTWIQLNADILSETDTIEIRLNVLDIQDRKIREVDALDETEKKWSVFADAIPDYLLQIDRQYRVMNVNRLQAGFKKAEFIGHDITMREPESERVSTRKKYDRIFETGLTESWELQAPISPERMGWYRVSASRLVDVDGEVSLLIISSDITEKKRADEKLRESEYLFRSTFEKTPVGMVHANLDGKFLRVNPIFCSMLGYTQEELQGFTFHVITYEDDLEADMANVRALQNGERERFTMEKRYWRKDRQLIWIHLSATVVRNDLGEPDYFIAVIQDISERKEMELKLSEANENLSLATVGGGIGIWDWDAITNKLAWDEQMFRLYGIPKNPLTLELQTWRNCVHPDDLSQTDIETEMALRGEKDFSLEFRIILPDNSVRHLASRGRLQRNEAGEPIKLIGINYDITELKRTEEELLQAKNSAESATRAKSEFLATMSHEIRTPLNGVIGFSDLLLRTELNEVQRKYMELVNKSANSLLYLLNDILDFSKIEAGSLELHFEKTNIIELIKDTSEIIRFQAENKKIDIRISIEPNIPAFVYVDSIRLKQILINLLGNAIKFTKSGEIEIKLETSSLGAQSDKVRFYFSVRDTGIGVSKENREKIFEAFSQEDSSTSRKYGGTGLGLTISNRLLELMDSKLELESELGKGSRFYFALDILIVEADKLESEKLPNASEVKIAEEIKKPADRSVSKKELKILIVDDVETNLLLARAILTRLIPNGIVIQATNGIEAIEKFRQEKVDLILMDIQMPEMNGFEATIEIRKLETGFRTPIIALTAGTVKDDIENCFLAGMDDYASKPIVMNTIEKVLKKWIEVIDSNDESIKLNFENIDSVSHFNFKEFKNKFEFHDETLAKILNTVNDSLLQSMNQIKENFKNQDIDSIHLTAHKIKGSALTIGNVELTNLTLAIEKEKKIDEALFTHLIQKMEIEINQIRKMISKQIEVSLSNQL